MTTRVPDPVTLQLWALLAGTLTPLGAYVLNYLGPWVDEKLKALVQVVLAAIAGAIVALVDRGEVGFDKKTLVYVLSAVIAALFSHGVLWRPSSISTELGGGRNAQSNP